MRPIFCGNLEKDVRQSELEQLFTRYGKVIEIKVKSGFAFIFMDDEHDAEDAIRGLDRSEFGRQGRRLQVEWTKQEHGGRAASNARPSKTLFVVNFDPINTSKRDFEKHFGPYGKILDIRMRSDFAFIEFELLEDAVKALEATNKRHNFHLGDHTHRFGCALRYSLAPPKKTYGDLCLILQRLMNEGELMDCLISVEYAACNDERGKGYNSGRRGRDRSPVKRNCDCGRSASSSRKSSDSSRPTKTLFIANFDPFDTRVRDLERHFEPYGKILDIRIKKSFAFIKFESQEDATDALKATHMSKLRDRVLSVEYVVSDYSESRTGCTADGRGHDYGRSVSSSRRSSSANLRPSKTLFVTKFAADDTKKLDFQRHFEPYGKLLDIRIRNNFAFVQFEDQEDASKALEATNMSELMGQVISVEYSRSGENGPNSRKNGSREGSIDSGVSASPGRGVKRGSPDYSLGSSPYRKPEQRRRHS